MFDLNWEETRAFYTAIGAIIINWGVAESSVSQACDILVAAGGHKSQRMPPKEFGRRIKLIKACFKDYPELAHMRDFCTSLISDTKKLVPHRDFIIHGVVTAYDRPNLRFEFVRLDAGKTEYDQNATKLTVYELLELSDAANKIGGDWIKLVEGLHSVRESPDGLKYADRVPNGAIRKWAYRVYEAIQRFVGLSLVWYLVTHATLSA